MKFKVEPMHDGYTIEFDPPAPLRIVGGINGWRCITAPTYTPNELRTRTNTEPVAAKVEISKSNDSTRIDAARSLLIRNGYEEVRP